LSPTVVPAPTPALRPGESVDRRKLEELAKPAEIRVPVSAPDPVSGPVKPQDLQKADEKLASLLRKPK